MLAKLLKLGVALAGFGSQNFLGHRWVGSLLATLPANRKRPAALRVLAMSPHYFFRTPSNAHLTSRDFLESEFARSRDSPGDHHQPPRAAISPQRWRRVGLRLRPGFHGSRCGRARREGLRV